MFRKLNLTIALLSIFGLANSAFASVYQTVDISTGVNVGAIGNPLYPVGGRDDYWTVRSVLGVPSQPNTPSWITSMPLGWNTIPGTRPIFGNNNNMGTSEYERCFCLQSIEKAVLTLTMRADNHANLYLNKYFGNPILQTNSNNTFSNSIQPAQFTYTAQTGLKVGLNCIRVRVNNEGGPTGFALNATLKGFGAQDNALEGCCRRSAPVFTEPLRVSPIEVNPRRNR
ncbi:MAG TPA: hypothetical protein VN844_01030 [Pyrinomonadaceae bacterium]|nr:hypothetical protein [Pyrinomonadaceae bacterium]